MVTNTKSILAALASTLLVAPAAGQTGSLDERLAGAARIECAFSELATGDWGDAAARFDVTNVDAEAAFFDIDIDEGTAEADGQFGASFIVVNYAQGQLNLIQSFLAGPLYVTTIFARETEDGRFAAVQARHEYTKTRLPGFTSRPELYVGDCEIAE